MQTHTKSAIGIVVLGLIGLLAYKLLLPLFESSQQKNTSDARATKGKIVIGVDNWIGYFPLCSPDLRKRMRRSGYNLQCQDDKADYAQRMQALADGDLQFAVATVDSYLQNARKLNYPGTIVAVIDESKGGDAIVAWKDKIKSIDGLKSQKSFKVAFTPDSPSEHLLKSMAVHFDVPVLLGEDNSWRVHTDGSEGALKKLLNKNVDAAVLWEPDVTKALRETNMVKLLGTEDTDKLVVDILVVNRKYSQREPEAVSTLLKQYFRTLKYYRGNSQALLDDAAEYSQVKPELVKTMLAGVDWVNLSQNSLLWYGTMAIGTAPSEGLVDAIEATARILADHGGHNDELIPDGDPYRLINSRFIGELYSASATSTQFGQTRVQDADVQLQDSLEKDFNKLSDEQWLVLREIGTLKILPIVFQSGVDELTPEGKEQLDRAVDNLKHYPNFRVMIKGHTGKRGNASANLNLSKERAEAVTRYLNVTYGIDLDRMYPQGFGGTKPLARKSGESSRAYNYRLPRVELFLVAEDI